MLGLQPTATIRADLGRRIELVSMDRFCGDATIGLYLEPDGDGAEVVSYSVRPEVSARLAWLAGAMRLLAGMTGHGARVAFACGAWHEKAARRAFLEAAKVDPASPLAPRPAAVHDARTDQAVTLTAMSGGAYGVSSVPTDPTATSRAPQVAMGLVKLADLVPDAADDTIVHTPCGARHDALLALLLPRAINVRAALREQELAASRGVLVAPSAQQQEPA